MDTSYLSQQVTTIIERLHGFFDEIGVPSHERDSRESEVGIGPKQDRRRREWLTRLAAVFGALRDPPQSAELGRQRET